MASTLATRLQAPVDVASLTVWRVLFGLLMAVTHARFVVEGWVEAFYVTPVFRFAYWGLSWLPALPGPALMALHLLLAGMGLALAVGRAPRTMALLLGLGMAATDALDLTNYLNHHYLAVLLCGLGALTLPRRGQATAPTWALWLLRAQVAIVYVFASVAKMGPDWLLHGQPLNTWLVARSDWPLLGPAFELRETAIAMSWAGMLYDLTIPGWLLWRRSRPFALVVLLTFHTMTALLFRIGIFPYLMTINALLFLAPDWPRRFAAGRWLLARIYAPIPARGDAVKRADAVTTVGSAAVPTWPLSTPLRPWQLGALGLYLLLQVTMPLRFLAYPGPVLWAEEGMRFSWRVMVREKHGDVSFRVRRGDGREVRVEPRHWLDSRQAREMASQPDMILQLAHRIADDHRARGDGEVAVLVDAWVSLNGRPPVRMIDPTVDLAREVDTLAPKPWILPPPPGPPGHFGHSLFASAAPTERSAALSIDQELP